jgi:hypothetical protein
MDRTTAKELLLLHSFSHPDSATDGRAETGFLGSLRPYQGHLIDENFREVMGALRVLGPELSSPALDREVIAALWAICHLGRAWGVEPEGMLRRNKLISDDDVKKLDDWIEAISWAVFCLLDGGDAETAFADHDDDQQTGKATP